METDLIPVRVLRIDFEAELATVKKDGSILSIGINLWELAGYARRSDGFQFWKYAAKDET